MALRVVGAGLGRTGTNSLKVALERLLGRPCYHMMEVFKHPEHIPIWHAAARGELPDWHSLFADFGAAVDWPAAAFWLELSAAFPDALVLLSVREPQSWWQSASETIFPTIQELAGTEWHAMVTDLFAARFTAALDDRATAMATFERHNARVRSTVPSHRLLEWSTADGWGPLCAALGVPVPSEPFPRTNTRADWQARRS